MMKDKILGAKLNDNKPIGHGVGRRKSAVARVWLTHGTGKIMVNGLTLDRYFDTPVERTAVGVALIACSAVGKFNIKANVQGGGKTGQADAVKLGIARALLQQNNDLREVLVKDSLLTSDSRLKERKKYGRKAARRGFQFVKR